MNGLKDVGFRCDGYGPCSLSCSGSLETRSMASVKVYASRRGVIVWDGRDRWQPDSGHYVLNFEVQLPARTARLPSRGRTSRLDKRSALV